LGDKKKKSIVRLNSQDEALGLFGNRDENLKWLEREAGVTCSYRDGEVKLSGALAAQAAEMLERLLERLRKGGSVTGADFKYGAMLINGDGDEGEDAVVKTHNGTGRSISPRSPTQRDYIRAIMKNDLVFAIGPAGTGKTYLAVAVAVNCLAEEAVKRIIICRPAVEAGEKLGFLPGDFQEKVDPYLRPVYDALFAMMNFEKCRRLMDTGVIEVAPLAFMRGRTLEDAYVILDEAQNTTVEQMKMFLTRLGSRSRAVITGDVTQIDLPPEKMSGLVDAERRLRSLPEIKFVRFSKLDVVRHELVAKIIRAYESENGEGDVN